MTCDMKGILLAGGCGTRLYPLTQVVSKHLMPVYDKPLIYYPLSVLMLAGIREILILSSAEYLPLFQKLLGDGKHWGLEISYLEQPTPDGVAQAFLLGEAFIHQSPVCLILGDNLFYGHGLAKVLTQAAKLQDGALIFGYRVSEPQHDGVIQFDHTGQVIDLQEKPTNPQSNYAIPGIYFFDHQVCQLAAQLHPSARNELEITDLCKLYLRQGQLRIELLRRGFAWLDTGTHKALHQAASFIQILEQRQGLKVACLEEIAYRLGYITAEDVYQLAMPLANSSYGQYLLTILEGDIPGESWQNSGCSEAPI